MKKISVIIPVYNSEKYLAECLDSVLAQTFTDFEVICIDDGSTDNSPNILEAYRNKDNRIKVITQSRSGVVAARNNAIKESVGEYIYPLDSDDIIDKTTLEKSYNAIIAGKGDIITCRVRLFGKKDCEMPQLAPTKFNLAFDNCLVNAALFRRTLFDKVGGYDPAFHKALEDWDFWLNCVFRQNSRIYRIPEILFYYRIKPRYESRNAKQFLYREKLIFLFIKKYPQILKYRILNHIKYFLLKVKKFIFQIRRKPHKTYVRLLRIPIWIIRFNAESPERHHFFLGFIPIFTTRR